MQFPSQTIPQFKKDKAWCQLHLDYGQRILRNSNLAKQEMDNHYKQYNGIKRAGSYKYLINTHGKENRAQFISYRSCTTKIQLMVGEFLTRPLNATVVTNNRDAKSQKMEQFEFTTGAMVAKKEIQELKDKAGVDVMEGAPIPEDENDPLWETLSFKDKEEIIMQAILDEQIPALDLRQKFANNLLDCAITSVMFGKIERNEKGDTDYINIDPRDAIYEEIKGDTYLEKSPIMGCRQWLPLHEILRKYQLTAKQIETVESIGKNPTTYYSDSIKDGPSGTGLIAEVIHVEWISSIPEYYQKIKKTANQLMLDPTEEFIYIPLDTDKYEMNKLHWDNKPGIEIVAKYREDLWEATRIGGLKELDVNCQRVPFQMRKVDNPAQILSSNYVGYLFNTVDGRRISLFQQMENWSNIFDITMYQILKDINKFKGKVLGFNTAGLPAKSTVKSIQYDMVNDGFMTYDTSASGNFHGRDVSLNSILQVEDLGLSSSFGALIQFKDDVLQMMDRMTGISENREGQIAASATATNTNSAIQASRTITEPFFYGVYSFIDKTLMKIIESTKVSWAFYKIEEGEQILGIDKWKFMKVTQEIGYKDYGVHLLDAGKYMQVKQFMQGIMQSSLNAREIRPEDALAFAWADSAIEQKQVLREGWNKVKEMQNQQAQMQQQSQAQMQQQQIQMQQQQLQQQLEIANADREDRQLAKLDEINAQADADIRVNAAKAGDEVTKMDYENNINNINNQDETLQ